MVVEGFCVTPFGGNDDDDFNVLLYDDVEPLSGDGVDVDDDVGVAVEDVLFSTFFTWL